MLVPWQRRQVSYRLTAGMIGVMPSSALMPVAPACGGRMAGGAENWNYGLEACALWQSTHVACRLLLSSATSAASWKLFPEGRGALTFAPSAMMLEKAC